jgi:hypothetical protein
MADQPTASEAVDLASVLTRTVVELLAMWASCFDGRTQNQHYLYRRVADEAAAARLRLMPPQAGN